MKNVIELKKFGNRKRKGEKERKKKNFLTGGVKRQKRKIDFQLMKEMVICKYLG
jgi:hypothetical protein